MEWDILENVGPKSVILKHYFVQNKKLHTFVFCPKKEPWNAQNERSSF